MVVGVCMAMLLSTVSEVSAHVSSFFLIFLIVSGRGCRDVRIRRLLVRLNTVGDSSSRFFARTKFTLDEVREGRRRRKRG